MGRMMTGHSSNMELESYSGNARSPRKMMGGYGNLMMVLLDRALPLNQEKKLAWNIQLIISSDDPLGC